MTPRVAAGIGASRHERTGEWTGWSGAGGWQINAINSTVTTRRTTPFGTERGPVAAWKGKEGFVGGTIDTDAGFTRVGARDYDTFAGRFLTIDPILDPKSPREWNPYQYGAWNPVNTPDPTGLKVCLETCNTSVSTSEGVKKVDINTYDQEYRQPKPTKQRSPGGRNSGRPGRDYQCIDSCSSKEEYKRQGFRQHPNGKSVGWVEPFELTVSNASTITASIASNLPHMGIPFCASCTLLPGGVTLNGASLAFFFLLVKPGSYGDPKAKWAKDADSSTLIDDSVYYLDAGDGRSVRYDIFGNISYGYGGRRLGIPRRVLDVHQVKGIGNQDPIDNASIQFGWDLAAKYPNGITGPQMEAEVRAAIAPGGPLEGALYGR